MLQPRKNLPRLVRAYNRIAAEFPHRLVLVGKEGWANEELTAAIREAPPGKEPFFTGYDVSHHSSGQFEHGRRGLGLGLSVVKAFIEMHGGTVRVDTEVGRGTTFTITLPVAPPRVAPSDTSVEAAAVGADI